MPNKLTSVNKEDVRGFSAGAAVGVLLILLNVSVYCFKCGRENVDAIRRIDPGSASVESLSRLDGIGLSKAENIVRYRESGEVIESEHDLRKVKGIGKKTVEKNREYLYFDGAKD